MSVRSQSISSGSFVYRRPLENSIVVRSINKYSKSFSIVWLNWMSAHSTHTFGRPYTWAAQPGTGTLFAQRSVFCPSPMHTKPAESVLFFWSSVCVYYPICSFNICIMCGCEFVRQMLLFLLAYVFRTQCGYENVCTYECAISLDYGFTNENKTATATTTFDEDILTCSVYFVPIETETIWMHESIWERERLHLPCSRVCPNTFAYISNETHQGKNTEFA